MSRQITPHSWGAGWVGHAYGDKSHYELRHEPEYVAMTGAVVNTEVFIPYPHRIIQVLAAHETAANAKVATALAEGLFQRKEWHAGNVAASQWFNLFNFGGLLNADHIQFGGEAWEFPTGYYRFRVNGTSGHLMNYKVRVQFLDKRGKELGGGIWR